MELYKTLTILKAIEQMPKVHTFLRDTFFNSVETFPTEDVLIDYTKGKRKMAPFVAPRTGGVTVKRDGYRTEKYTAPRIAPQKSLTIDDISKRLVGESIVSTKTPAQRARELLAKDLVELNEMISRREEWLVAQTLVHGKVIMKGYTGEGADSFVEQELDFNFTQSVTLSGFDTWDNYIKDPHGEYLSNPYEDIKGWRKEVTKNSGLAPDILLLGGLAEKAFTHHPVIQSLLDKKNMLFGTIEPSIQSDVVTFIGKLPGLGVEIYTYDDWYLDDDGEEKPYIPADTVILAKKKFAGFAYGAITQMEKNDDFVTYEGERVPKIWADHQNEQKMVRLTARSVPKPGNVDAWLTAKVVQGGFSS